MVQQSNYLSETQELYRLLKTPEKNFLEMSLKELRDKVLAYVYDPYRLSSFTDYNLIKLALYDCWNLLCIEVNSTIESMGPIKMPGKQLGRCSVRLLNILNPTQFYIVLDQTASINEKRLALLHEVGHFLLHFEIFQSMGTLFHRICLNPALEFEIGRFMLEKGQVLSALQEKEADLFALTWLLPLWMDGTDETDEAYNNMPPGLTLKGYKFKVFRDLFSDQLGDLAIDKASIPVLNERGEEKSRWEGSRLNYALDESLTSRLSWLFFNRYSMLNNIDTQRSSLMKEFFKVIGIPRYIPELTGSETFCRSAQLK